MQICGALCSHFLFSVCMPGFYCSYVYLVHEIQLCRIKAKHCHFWDYRGWKQAWLFFSFQQKTLTHLQDWRPHNNTWQSSSLNLPTKDLRAHWEDINNLIRTHHEASFPYFADEETKAQSGAQGHTTILCTVGSRHHTSWLLVPYANHTVPILPSKNCPSL